MSIDVCVPILNRYDLFDGLYKSLEESILVPRRVLIVDNGLIAFSPRHGKIPVEVYTPKRALGVAESWNWFAEHTFGDIIVTNDDIIFAPESLSAMLHEDAIFVSCTYGFSCFLWRRECIALIGKFDESISPGYAYYEDRDYFNRMQVAGVQDIVVECGVQHLHSQTLAAMSPQERSEHNRRFGIAHKNYVAKWGESPWSPSLSRQ